MDKIQTAIAKARAERPDTETDATPELQRRPAATGTPAGIDAAWDALRPLDIPKKVIERNRIVAAKGGHDTAAFDMLRTRIMQQMRANGWKRLAITSPTASCGKSTIALNLAMSLSRLTDARSVLLELDLRRPALAKMLGMTQNIQFSQVLKGETSFQQNALRFGPSLAVSTNARSSRNPAELLSDKRVSNALEMIEAEYAPDIVVFDMPPMMVTDDMLAFAPHVDCALLIAAAEATTIKEIDTCESDLASQTNVMGVILNKCRFMGKEYKYSYY